MNQQPTQVFLAPANLMSQQPTEGSGRRRRRKNRNKKKKDDKKKTKSIWKTWELWAVVAFSSLLWGPSLAWLQSKAFVIGLLILHDAANNVSKVLAPIAQ